MTVIISIIIILAVLYLLAIMPRMVHKPDKTPFMGVLYAHRGLHDNEGDAPENSLKALKKAIDRGFGVELDVQLTKDKIPVVFHDFTLKRVCGEEGKVSDYTYDELQQFHLYRSDEKIPRFEDFLKLADGKIPLIVELKIEWTDVSVCELADRLLKEYKGAYCIESFNPLGLIWYKKHRKEVMRGQLSDVFKKENGLKGPLYFSLEHLLLNCVTKPDFIAYNHKYHRMPSRWICRRLFGNLAVAWTIKTQQQLDMRKKDFDLFIFDSFIPEKRVK
ncbi:glycerophosphodiester phosphodiesterase family protein [Kineothrix sedimenti]|uniref:Glycerophosphodiester phosphodiesterase family protein n=1 Tax=Kineothrix sedimenti TaxID=3123317 RepID=A0ABZ3ER97_9FIRM